MSDGTCRIDGCDDEIRSRDLCSPHYYRLVNHGDPLAGGAFRERNGIACKVAGCDAKPSGKGMCKKHYQRWQKYGDPKFVTPRSGPARSGPNHGMWIGDRASYSAVHARLKELHGPASQYSCSECGQCAANWAYDNRDPDEKQSEHGCAYSTDLNHYRPMCLQCHKAFDISHARQLDDDGLMSTAEYAKLLGIAPRTVRLYVKKGILEPAVRMPHGMGRYRFDPQVQKAVATP